MASQSKVEIKTKQELLEYIKKVRVVITDDDWNCVHVYNDDNKGSSTQVIISDNEELTGRRMHCNDTFIVVALSTGGDGRGGYMIGNVHDFTKNKCKIVKISYDVFAIFITNDNKVALGGTRGEVQLNQVDGKQTRIWCRKIHDDTVRDIKVHNSKIFTASEDRKCGVITMSDGSVLHMFNAPDWLNCVCVVNDDVVLTGCDDGNVYRHDMSTTTTSVFVTPGGSGSIWALALSSDSNILCCGGVDNTLYAINMKTNNTLLWKIKCENIITSICVQYGIVCVGVARCNVVCVNEHNGEIITTLLIKPQDDTNGIIMIPPNGVKPVAPPIADPHKQCKEQIQQLTQERDAANQQAQRAQLQLQQAQQDAQQQKQQAQQQIDKLSQQETLFKQRILELETENNRFKQDQVAATSTSRTTTLI